MCKLTFWAHAIFGILFDLTFQPHLTWLCLYYWSHFFLRIYWKCIQKLIIIYCAVIDATKKINRTDWVSKCKQMMHHMDIFVLKQHFKAVKRLLFQPFPNAVLHYLSQLDADDMVEKTGNPYMCCVTTHVTHFVCMCLMLLLTRDDFSWVCLSLKSFLWKNYGFRRGRTLLPARWIPISYCMLFIQVLFCL